MSRQMEIDVWSGDWGLPSIDVQCLQILVYCKFSGVALQINPTNNPYKSTLPTFRSGSSTLHKLTDVVSFLKGKNINADYHLDTVQIAAINAYEQLLLEKLQPALQYVWFIDPVNYTELTRPWYAKALPFPLNYYYPGRYEREAHSLISALYCEEDPTAAQTHVYSDAEKCLTLLSSRLGNSTFFFGDAPSSLDALVFSYLAPLLLAPFPQPKLQNHLKACTNLVAFVNAIMQKYYPSLKTDYQRKATASKREEAESDFPNKGRNKLLFGLLGATAMTGYALSSGLLQVSFGDDDDDYDDFEVIDDSGSNSADE